MSWNPNIPTVTNRVQDDLDAIRQNFEALDGLPQDKTNILELAGEKDNILGHLADTNNPHNVQASQVPYSSGVVGFSPADVKAALDALAGVRIVEMSSNSNGTYVRWENGLQVCFARRTASQVSGTLLRSSWTFPAAFIDANYAVVFGLGDRPTIAGDPDPYAKTLWLHAFDRTASACDLRLFVNDRSAVSGDSATFDAVAVGRWK